MYQGAGPRMSGGIGGGELWSDDVYLHSRRRGCGRCLLFVGAAIIVIGVIIWLGLVV